MHCDLVSPLTAAAQNPTAPAGPQPAQKWRLWRAHAFRLHHRDAYFPLFTLIRMTHALMEPGFLLYFQVGNKTRSRAGCCVPLCDAVMAADKSGFCRTLGRKICLHLFVFVFYKDQMDALSLFFFFFVLIFGREKPQERLTLKFLWMPLLCARTSRLAYWDNTGYPQHKRSATHLSSCTAVCVAVLPIAPPKAALYVQC